MHDSEPLANGMDGGDAFVTTIHSTPSDTLPIPNASPQDFPAMLSILDTWHNHVLDNLGLWQGQNADMRRHRTQIWSIYTRSTITDRHLMPCGAHNGILPYCWVEAAGTNLSTEGLHLPGPGGINNERGLPYLVTDALTYHDGAHLAQDAHGCVIGSPELYRISHWQLRAQGMTYLCHPRFSDRNGLSVLNVLLADTVTLNLADEFNLANEAREETSIADKIWERPHCAVPFNGEVSIVGDVSAGLVCRSSRHTNYFAWCEHHNIVNVRVGPLLLTDDEDRVIVESRNRSTAALIMLREQRLAHTEMQTMQERALVASTQHTHAEAPDNIVGLDGGTENPRPVTGGPGWNERDGALVRTLVQPIGQVGLCPARCVQEECSAPPIEGGCTRNIYGNGRKNGYKVFCHGSGD